MSWSIQIEDLAKRYYRAGFGRLSNNFRESLTNLVRGSFRNRSVSAADQQFWALKNINLSIREGEMVGIIGKNGAGKSTLLKILSRITPPTEGCFRFRGKLISLLEIGAGFHNQLTGRENIFLNGSILGLSRNDIRRKMDQIVEFAGIGTSLDTPVKFYSSGMYTRLAFSVAAHLETDILLVDEVLAVGDAEFQKRCTRRMGDVAKSGRTVILVSHNMGLLQHQCSRGIVLDQGQVKFDGPIQEAVNSYLFCHPSTTAFTYPDNFSRTGSGIIRVRSASFEARKANLPKLICGQEGAISLKLETNSSQLPIRDADIVLTFYSLDGIRLLSLWSRSASGNLVLTKQEEYCTINIPKVPLRPGEYRLEVRVSRFFEPADWIEDAGIVEIGEGDFYGTGLISNPENGPIFCDHSWRVI
jgi:lipopolysaccharide transport system ATP-binding protein